MKSSLTKTRTELVESTERMVKGHPMASAGALLGAGVLVGVAAQRALGHKPTVGEVVMGALRSNAAKQLSATKKSLRRVLK